MPAGGRWQGELFLVYAWDDGLQLTQWQVQIPSKPTVRSQDALHTCLISMHLIVDIRHH